MCGIFGTLTTSRQIYADDFLADAFVASMLRGVDSSGIASINLSDNSYYLHKLPVNGLFFKDDRVAKRYMGYATTQDTLTMCHVRAATVGSISMSNAHPFEIERTNGDVLLGTHNGTLQNWKHLKSAKGYDVDSEWAMAHIANEGMKAFEDFTGAYAFVWWDGGDAKVLHMARNNERPINIAFLKDGGMVYASEPGMLFWLAERNNLKLDGPILSLDVDQHYMFPTDNPKQFTKEPIPKKVYTYSSTYGTNTTSTYKTTVDNVKEIIAAAGQQLPATESATAKEAQLAKDYGWYGERAIFTPVFVDAGVTEGAAEACRTEFDAKIKGDMFTKGFDPNHDWLCTVIGVEETDKDIILILSQPYRTMPEYVEQEGAV